MFSKLIRPINSRVGLLLSQKVAVIRPVVRRFGELFPPSQYDTPFPDKLKFLYVIRKYWEIIPLFVVTATSLFCMVVSIAWAIRNKVDIVFTSRSRENISRTMDLRSPTVHKMIIINQRYEPWPEMQAVLDKMVMAEKRALVRQQTCSPA